MVRNVSGHGRRAVREREGREAARRGARIKSGDYRDRSSPFGGLLGLNAPTEREPPFASECVLYCTLLVTPIGAEQSQNCQMRLERRRRRSQTLSIRLKRNGGLVNLENWPPSCYGRRATSEATRAQNIKLIACLSDRASDRRPANPVHTKTKSTNKVTIPRSRNREFMGELSQVGRLDPSQPKSAIFTENRRAVTTTEPLL